MSILVSGSVTWVDPYKGGARPPPEVEEEGRRTKPCANHMLHVRPANADGAALELESPPLAELRTDAEGNFEIELAPGTYHIFRASKLGVPGWHAQEQEQSSDNGLPRRMVPGASFSVEENVRWRRKPDASLEVVASGTEQRGVTLHWVNDRERGLPMPC